MLDGGLGLGLKILESAADFLSKECPMTYVRQMMEDERGYSEDLWNKMAGLGWMGLSYPEEFGGAGLTMVDLVVVLEEMGRVALPGPFFSTVTLGGLAILEAGSSDQKKRFLPGLVAGKTKATLALLEENARVGRSRQGIPYRGLIRSGFR